MSEGENEIKFACIGCGTFNSPTAEVCEGCGHRFGGPDLVPKTRIVMLPRVSENPYAPPLPSDSRRGTFQIGSLLVWIAVIAVCLGAAREHLALGALAVLSFVPATIRTSMAANARKEIGRPMHMDERFASFVMTMIAVWTLVISTAIAFCVSCFGVASMTNSIGPALVIGAGGAIAWAIWTTRLMLKNSQERLRRESEIRYR